MDHHQRRREKRYLDHCLTMISRPRNSVRVFTIQTAEAQRLGGFWRQNFKVNKASQDQGQTSRPCSLEAALLTKRQGELKACGALAFELKAWVKQTVLDLADRHGYFLMWESEFHAFVPQAHTILSILRTDRDFFPFFFLFLSAFSFLALVYLMTRSVDTYFLLRYPFVQNLHVLTWYYCGDRNTCLGSFVSNTPPSLSAQPGFKDKYPNCM